MASCKTSPFPLFTTCLVLIVGLSNTKSDEVQRVFTIDHENNTFLMDGKPFQYVAGSFHYFRAFPDAWLERLRTMRAAGLNAIDTYVEWSLHNPEEGVYVWEGIADLERFMELAWEEEFYIILRPGPYICAERDNGGIPYWLFTKYPNIKLRTNDPDYTREIGIWYSQLMPRLQRFLYGNGGPIIMIQVENEYSSFSACDNEYKIFLRDETEKYVESKALLFTTDMPDDRMRCGKIEGVFATTDFGHQRVFGDLENIWNMLRKVQPTGPLVNSEFYPGWLTVWQENLARVNGQEVAKALKILLEQGANVNLYMFFGGTNFGFTTGAGGSHDDSFTPVITSYDYDAPMDEAGGITNKYDLIKKVILEHFNITNPPSLPASAPRLSYGEVSLTPIARLFSKKVRNILGKLYATSSSLPKTFEELGQFSGLMLYETVLPIIEADPTILTVEHLRDRAYAFVDERLIGTLSRSGKIYSMPISRGLGNSLQLFVENQGRVNYQFSDDVKGILGSVGLQNKAKGQNVLNSWNITGFPLNEGDIDVLLEEYEAGNLSEIIEDASTSILSHGPTVYYGEFTINESGHTFLNTAGWGKGVAYVNGMNLGRYWPLVGPQITLYVPNQLLQAGVNKLVLIEYQRANRVLGSNLAKASFDSQPRLG